MKSEITVKALECVCEAQGCPRNREPWVSLGQRPPKQCPTCRSREWDGPKQKRKPARAPRIELPKPVKVREIEEEF